LPFGGSFPRRSAYLSQAIPLVKNFVRAESPP